MRADAIDAPTILVVEDDPDFRAVLAFALQRAGYTVEEADDGVLALERIATHVPDLILTDVQMPHLEGLGLARRLASHMPPIPIILMSVDPLPGDSALPFIHKPFQMADLLILLARTLL